MKTKEKKRFLILGVAAALVILLCVAAFWRGLTVRVYTETTDKVSSTVRLAVIADLHSTLYGDGQEELLKAIRKQKPDAVLLLGDIVDNEKPQEDAWELLSVIGAEYPCYYVSGNHEYWSGKVDSIKETIRSYGITVLEGETEIAEIGGQELRICGVDDPCAFGGYTYSNNEYGVSWQEQFDLSRAVLGDSIYSILLSHRPELTDKYENSGFDLVLAGHAHGGQFRIPGILNGLEAPNQGWFPDYAGGRYQLGGTVMIVSRGLQKDSLPRIFNPPELVIVELRAKE